MIFAIPIVAIVGNYVLRYRKLEIDRQERMQLGAGKTLSPDKTLELEMTIRRLDAENSQLRKRLENVETIVTSVEWDQLRQLDLYTPPQQLPPPADKTVN